MTGQNGSDALVEGFLLSSFDLMLMLRVTIAFALGGLLGFERERLRRPAGLRTHMLVAGGAACFTLASAYGFEDRGVVDPSRIAAQVVTGVGFLGAGTIFRTESTVRGLTTAASIWVAAALGLLVGAGMYSVAVFTAIVAWVALHLLRGVVHGSSEEENHGND